MSGADCDDPVELDRELLVEVRLGDLVPRAGYPLTVKV